MRKRAALIGLTLALVGALFIVPRKAGADVTYTIAFYGDIVSYTVLQGSVVSGGNPDNMVEGIRYGDGEHYDYISASVRMNLPTTCVSGSTVSATLQNRFHQTGSNPNYAGWSIVAYDSPGGTSDVLGGAYNNSNTDGAWNDESTGDSTVTVSTNYVEFRVYLWEVPASYNELDNLSFTCSPVTTTPTPTTVPSATPDPSGLTMPLGVGDRSSMAQLLMPTFSDYDQNSQNTAVISYSNAVGAPVHAVLGATVDSITPLLGTCVNNLQLKMPVPGVCATADEYSLHLGYNDVPDFIKQYITQAWGVYLPLQLLYFANAYNIKTTDPAGKEVWYVVQNPRVVAGDTLTPGCIIGDTLPMAYVDLTGGDVNYVAHSTPTGWTLVQARDADDAWLPLKPLLLQEPNSIACTLSTRPPSSCRLVANATFQDITSWNQHPNSIPYPLRTAPDGGLLFPANVEQILNLDSAQQYRIHVKWTSDSALEQRFAVRLGNESPHWFSVVGDGEATLDADTYAADRADGLYTLFIQAGEGDADHLTLRYICVDDADDIPAIGECIVLDRYFSQSGALSPWVTAGGATVGNGYAQIPHNGDIRQSLKLNPASGGGEQVYVVSLSYRRVGQAVEGKTVFVGVDWGAFSTGTDDATTQIWANFSDTFSVTTTSATHDLIISATGSDADQVAQVTGICIKPEGGGVPPGYHPLPVFADNSCRMCIYTPTGDLATDLSEYVQWLACQFVQLWECQLKILLGRMWVTILNILSFLGFMRIWLNAVIVGLFTWANGNVIAVTRWLNGQFVNLQIVFQNSLTNLRSFTLINGGGAGFWDAIIAVANAISGMASQLIAGIGTPIILLLQQIVSGLFGLLIGAMGILGTLLTIAFTWLTTQASLLINMLGGIITALYTALNTAAIAVPPGAPMCESPGTVLYYPCLGFYVLDNTIFSGPVIYIVPIFMGLMSWRVLLWAVHRVKGVFAG